MLHYHIGQNGLIYFLNFAFENFPVFDSSIAKLDHEFEILSMKLAILCLLQIVQIIWLIHKTECLSIFTKLEYFKLQVTHPHDYSDAGEQVLEIS